SAGVWWSQQRRPSAQPNEATAQTESPSSPRPSPAPSAQDRERTPPDVPPSGNEQPVESKEQAKQRAKPPAIVPGTVPITVTRGSSASAKNGAPEAARSALTVGCTPWAEVTLDGKPLGNTPLRRVSVPTGAHTLELRHPPSGRSKRLELTVADDMTVIVNLNSDEVRFK
ncbi:MAG: PEGA domain-containing protein, partial [Myxococcota bacterium]